MGVYEWNDNLINLQYQKKCEDEVCRHTTQQDAKGLASLTNLINMFFRLSYCCNEPAVTSQYDQYFLHVAAFTYYRLPYTLRSVQQLWMQGHYLEAVVLLRHLLEGLVALRYFDSRRDKVKAHYDFTSKNGKIQWKQMFDACAPGLYEYYGRISNMAHGGLRANDFWTYETSQTQPGILVGSKFILDLANYVYVHAGIVSYGYLNHVSTFFPSVDSRIDATTLQRKTEMLHYLQSTLLAKADESFVQAVKPLVTIKGTP